MSGWIDPSTECTFRLRRIRSASSSLGRDCGIQRAGARSAHSADTALALRCMTGGSRRPWRHLTGRLPHHLRRHRVNPSVTVAAAGEVPARTRCYGYLERS